MKRSTKTGTQRKPASPKKAPSKRNAQPKSRAESKRRASGQDPLEPEVVSPEIVGAAPETKAVAISDPLTLYLNEIRKYDVLSPEEEKKFAFEYYETKNPKAAEKLVTSNLRFVVKVAAEYSKFGARMIDLIQEGNVGLMHAVREFNPYKGVRLITYAVWWIRGYIQEYLLRQYSLVRIGTTQAQRKLFYQLQQERKKLESMGIEPEVALLSSRLGVSESDVEMMKNRMQNRDVSLDAPIGSDERAHFIDLQPAIEDKPVDEILGFQEELEQLKEKIEAVRSQLNEKEAYILEHRILGDPPLTLQEIGEKYGMTRERARQLEARVISKIKSAYVGGASSSKDQD